ncbi:hypothetical protein [Wolbachia endosymbiont of Dipetalonema caudispina]|uniref:hypothetical protein n=1 Tax=Wolbachia endosymbiont of Dipetalonema caudispina TaxID=1812112 RepID=UPI0021083147|nr:hypothetical protein [Wolbachia endosymbiont of Dipetalonema caudispina]
MLDIGGLFLLFLLVEISNVYKAISTILGQNFDFRYFANLSLHLSKQSIKEFIQELFKNIKLFAKLKELIMNSFIFYAKSYH